MKIGVIGLGLIGGSIVKNLVNSGHELYAVTGHAETIAKVQNKTEARSHDYSILLPISIYISNRAFFIKFSIYTIIRTQ